MQQRRTAANHGPSPLPADTVPNPVSVSESHPSPSRLASALKFALASRLYYFALAWTARRLAPDFDASSLPSSSTLIKWDALHFEAIATNGYQHELQLAFFPLVPTAARTLARAVGVTPAVGGIVWSNAMFFLAVVALYNLAHKVTVSHHAAYTAAVRFAIQPASIFLMSMYTESTFAALTFLGMLAWEHSAPWTAALAWSLACCTRSNGLLHTGFFAYTLLFSMIIRKGNGIRWVTNVCAAVCVPLTYLAVQAYGTHLFCHSSDLLPAWCPPRSASGPLSWVGFPYAYVQRKYWNVGLFRYWTLGNLPNFVLAAPILAHSLVRIGLALFPRWYNQPGAPWSPRRVWRALQPAVSASGGDLGPVYHVQHMALVLVAVCGMHVQVAVRMFSSIPGVFLLPLWEQRDEGATTGWVRKWQTGWEWYSVVWSSVGAVLFGLFYPPA